MGLVSDTVEADVDCRAGVGLSTRVVPNMAASLLLLLFVGLFAPHRANEASNLQTCIDSFVVHSDKIIRTQDSTALGAKYLTQSEVVSRQDCLQLCCETATCDVFVYEHKRRGSCYLFHCGDPQDFKCKFTQHGNYSSGVLMPPNELESEIKLTKHEEELARLSKKIEVAAETTLPPIHTTIKIPAAKLNATLRSECSRYQFECRSTRECIAIYNACDGIAQCPDGSDEGPELDCPSVAAGPVRPSPRPEKKHEGHHEGQLTPDVKKSLSSSSVTYQQFVPPDKNSDLTQQAMEQQILSQGRGFGREGEAPPEAPGPWRSSNGQQRRPQDERSRGFLQKNSLAAESESVPAVPYGADIPHGLSSSNSYYGSNLYNMPPYWAPRQRGDDPRWMYPGPPPPADYYYEESQMRGRPPPSQPDHNIPEPAPVQKTAPEKIVEKATLIKVQEGKPEVKETLSVKKAIPEETTTKPPVTPSPPHQPLGLVMDEDEAVLLDADGENKRPRGAILSLALGMCVAAIMVTLVGCRLRIVQRRLRRGAKSGYAHDADFLVNGMYL